MGFICANFNTPVASMGVGHSDSRVHAPNENILLENFLKATWHLGSLLERLGQ
jgi:acetylornithine deacetylase/succinyl-diaminopimelate desuccinylase-like protein